MGPIRESKMELRLNRRGEPMTDSEWATLRSGLESLIAICVVVSLFYVIGAIRKLVASRRGTAALATTDSVYPLPPSLHWIGVLILTILTGGLFWFVWMWIQVRYVARLRPTSRVRMLMVIFLLASYVSGVLLDGGQRLKGVGAILVIPTGILYLVICVLMHDVLVRHFTKVEPMGLRLRVFPCVWPGINVLYFQYHLTEIANRRRGVPN
jgi:hypothetical protein